MARVFIQLEKTAPIAPHNCSCGSCGNGLAELFLDLGLVEPDHMPPLVGREFGVEFEPEPALLVLQYFLENLVVEPEHDVAVHLDEAAIAVIGEARVAGILRQRLDRLVVEAEIEHGVHHARHRGARAGAHRNQQQFLPDRRNCGR